MLKIVSKEGLGNCFAFKDNLQLRRLKSSRMKEQALANSESSILSTDSNISFTAHVSI